MPSPWSVLLPTPTLRPLYSGGLWEPVIMHSPSTGSVCGGEVGERRRHHAQVDDVDPGRVQAGDHRLREARAREPAVAPHHHPAPAGSRTSRAEGAAHQADRVLGEVLVHQAADVVLAEDGRRERRAHPRCRPSPARGGECLRSSSQEGPAPAPLQLVDRLAHVLGAAPCAHQHRVAGVHHHHVVEPDHRQRPGAGRGRAPRCPCPSRPGRRPPARCRGRRARAPRRGRRSSPRRSSRSRPGPPRSAGSSPSRRSRWRWTGARREDPAQRPRVPPGVPSEAAMTSSCSPSTGMARRISSRITSARKTKMPAFQR